MTITTLIGEAGILKDAHVPPKTKVKIKKGNPSSNPSSEVNDREVVGDAGDESFDEAAAEVADYVGGAGELVADQR